MDYATRFRAIREGLGETQSQMAKRFSVETATYARWEQGAIKRPSPQHRVTLRLLECRATPCTA